MQCSRYMLATLAIVHATIFWSCIVCPTSESTGACNSYKYPDNGVLYRWGFVTHGGIDGFSRLVTFMRCSTNNEAITVFR